MYLMNHEITIGGVKFAKVVGIKIKKDVNVLTDKATIVLPLVAHGRELPEINQIRKWQQVEIRLGYDDTLNTEFSGIVKSVSFDDDTATIECEDDLYLLQRVLLPNSELKPTTLKDVLNYTISETNKWFRENGSIDKVLDVDCQFSYGYDKFVFKETTAYKVFELIQKEGNPNIFMKENTIHIQPQYVFDDGVAVYSLSKNIQKDGLQLKWRNESDRNLLVKVSAVKKDGTRIEATAGKGDDDVMSVKLNTIQTQKDLQTIADNLLRQNVFTGYEGTFNAWLLPFCDANFIVDLRDDSHVLRSGRYYVVGVDVDYSSAGGVRTVHLGATVGGS